MSAKIPAIPIHDKRFEYRNSAATDVTITWRKFGWIPKGEENGQRNQNRNNPHHQNIGK